MNGRVHFHASPWRDIRVDAERRPAEPCLDLPSGHDRNRPRLTRWGPAGDIGPALQVPRYSAKPWARETAMREAKAPALGAESDLAKKRFYL